MYGELTNHLWQSTLFAIAAGAMAFVIRKNRAEARYWLWFSASLKFLIPFSFLVALGSLARSVPAAKRMAEPAISFTIVQIAQPFSRALASAPQRTDAGDWLTPALFVVWLCGFGAIVVMRFRSWLSIRAAMRCSVRLDSPAPVVVRSAPGLLEPGVAGVFHPIILLPEGIGERLEQREFDAVLAHELCHIQRRDNLMSSFHMVVEAVFWFHPLVWFIGARLMEERERACDESVVRQGNQPRDYAEGILKVCRSYLESPLLCVSGVTGANLKRRIQAILQGRISKELSLTKKLVLGVAAAAAVTLPIGAGIIGSAHAPAQPVRGAMRSTREVTQRFSTASVKGCDAFRNAKVPEEPGTFQSGCTTLQRFMQQAYGTFANGHANPLSTLTITGGPAWTDSQLYKIDARATAGEGQLMMKGPMLQALLEERFKLKVHRETREIPIYELTTAQSGPKVQRFTGSCTPWNYDHPNPGPEQCAAVHPSPDGIQMKGWTVADLCYFFTVVLGEPVIDQTGYAERFSVDLALPTQVKDFISHGAHSAPARTDFGATARDSALVSAIETVASNIGFRLRPATQAGEFIVIDQAEKPAANFQP